MEEKKIILSKILENYCDLSEREFKNALDAMEEACKQVLELAVKKMKSDALQTFGTEISDCWDEDSITNTINLVEKNVESN